jgi:Peroxisomal biogenesis factor 11 (PEX11)
MILSAKVSSKIKDSMSQSRKIFRFLNFIIQIRKIYLISLSRKSPSLKFLLILQHFCAVLFYISDSILLFVLLASSLFPPSLRIPIKKIKNLASLARLSAVLGKIALSLRKRGIRERERREEVEKNKIEEGNVLLMEKIIKERRK